ncbi:MAG: FAD binding domain-containing protein [Actinobacteria bacterium]|nr:FAD binding domain-containing protein [Actinomycetota bacterium]
MKAAGALVLAGGTDVYPTHVGRPIARPIVDIAGLDALKGIEVTHDGYRLGALARWSEVAAANLAPRFDALRAAAREVGAIQVQNAGTIGGNLCTASPAADGVPNLLTLDASVELTSPSSRRVLPLEGFLTGYRSTALGDDELLTAVLIPRGGDDARATFLKLGLRRYLVISVVMVSAVIDFDERGRVREARVAVGACSPVAQRLRALEADLRGKPADSLEEVVAPAHLAELTPIDDVRATADYRRRAAATLVGRALAACGRDR